MNIKLERLLKVVWFTKGLNGRWGLPLIIQGRPGTAKTSRIFQAAKQCGLRLESVIASIREPADFLGLPVPTADGAVHYAPPRWALDVDAKGAGVVLFDELNTAPPAVQAGLLRCTLEGVVGDKTLSPRVRFVAAQNAVEDAAGGYDLAAPLANRFGHLVDMKLEVDDWVEWLLAGGGDNVDSMSDESPEAIEAMVESRWLETHARTKGAVSGFLRRKRDLLLKQPKAEDPARSGAWPSPRSWDMAMRASTGADIHGLDHVSRDELVAAYVGQAAATELAAYTKEVDLPDPAAVLDGKTKWKPDNERLDRTAAVLNSCAALVCPTAAPKRKERAGALWSLMEPIAADQPDTVFLTGRSLVRAGLGSATCKEARPLQKLLAPALKAANLMQS